MALDLLCDRGVPLEHQRFSWTEMVQPPISKLDTNAFTRVRAIASIEEQHTTQYESIIDPRESALEKLLLHEANEAYCYWSCIESEEDPRVRAIWERMLEYELGHVAGRSAVRDQVGREDGRRARV